MFDDAFERKFTYSGSDMLDGMRWVFSSPTGPPRHRLGGQRSHRRWKRLRASGRR